MLKFWPILFIISLKQKNPVEKQLKNQQLNLSFFNLHQGPEAQLKLKFV